MLVGAEDVSGWRWPQLAGARGHLGSLEGRLPRVDGVDVLSMDRDRSGHRARVGPESLRAEQLAAVLGSATRSHDLTVVDLPRPLGGAAREVVGRADLVVFVVRADVRGVAAGREAMAALQEGPPVRVLVRRQRGSTVSARSVAEALGLELVGVLLDEPSLPLAAERGDPPGRGSRAAVPKLCREVLLGLSEAARAA